MKARRSLILLAVLAGLAGCGGDHDSGEEARAVSVRIESPADGERTRSATISVVGTATGAAEVTVNGKSATLRPAGAARSFEVPVRLRLGENEIVVEGSGGGQSARETLTVIRRRGRGGREKPKDGSGGGTAEAPPGQGTPPAPSQGGAPAPSQGGAPAPSQGAPPSQGGPPADPAPPRGESPEPVAPESGPPQGGAPGGSLLPERPVR